MIPIELMERRDQPKSLGKQTVGTSKERAFENDV